MSKAISLLEENSPFAISTLAAAFCVSTGLEDAQHVRFGDSWYIALADSDGQARLYTARQAAMYLRLEEWGIKPAALPIPFGDCHTSDALARKLHWENGWTLLVDQGCGRDAIKVCPCGCRYDRPMFDTLPAVGPMEGFMLRNCACGSTVIDPLPMHEQHDGAS